MLILLTNIERKIVRNRFFDCHLSPNWRQMAIKTLFLVVFDPRSSIIKSVFDCCLSGVRLEGMFKLMLYLQLDNFSVMVG